MPASSKSPPPFLRKRIDQVRRRLEQRADQAAALLYRRVFGPEKVPEFDGKPALALVTVNYSTLRWLKLMLLSLCEQDSLHLVHDIVIVDNASRDGSQKFLHKLAAAAPTIHVIENRYFPNHARGMRLGFKALTRKSSTANVVLSIDTDVVFLRKDTLQKLAGEFAHSAVLAGEMRHGLYEVPEAQASFVAARRDVMARRDVLPWVNHGAPSYWMQKSIRNAGLLVSDFRNNHDGYALHRGRTAVAAAKTFHPASSYGSVPNNMPHYMGIPQGPEIWRDVESQWEKWLVPEAQDECISLIAERLALRDGATRA